MTALQKPFHHKEHKGIHKGLLENLKPLRFRLLKIFALFAAFAVK